MPVPFQLRRDATAARLSYVPLAGELFFDTDATALFLGNGAIAGGIQVGIPQAEGVSASTYTVLEADAAQLLVFTNAGGCAVTLPQAGSSGGAFLPALTAVWFLNFSAQAVIITPATSTINGLTTLDLDPLQYALVLSDGTNYYAFVGSTNSVKRLTPTTFANRPATPVAGMQCYFTDSTTATWGATISGTGGNHVVGWYNGTNWTVVGA